MSSGSADLADETDQDSMQQRAASITQGRAMATLMTAPHAGAGQDGAARGMEVTPADAAPDHNMTGVTTMKEPTRENPNNNPQLEEGRRSSSATQGVPPAPALGTTRGTSASGTTPARAGAASTLESARPPASPEVIKEGPMVDERRRIAFRQLRHGKGAESRQLQAPHPHATHPLECGSD